MVVRVRLRISDPRCSRSVATRALVNSGAESEEPVVVVDLPVARELGLELEGMDVIEVELASGVTHCYITRGKYLVELMGNGDALSSTWAYVAVDPNLAEPLITDATIDELGIMVLSFKRGLWRHAKDPPSALRESA
ncbi:MAG: hypothetical protein N3H31_05015 [Candidatus Nezhaarchaeota archaeon]|nr:hypothetical protein [Candidatus Nezhaarchaeota archaeon]